MFDLKDGLHKLHEIGEEQSDPIIICKTLSISLMDIYNNINIQVSLLRESRGQ